MNAYVHGYSDREKQRLEEQSGILETLLHAETTFPENSHVLEAGCGVGAQSVILGKRSPSARFTAVDISKSSLKKAAAAVQKRDLTNFKFQQASILSLPFEDSAFDHIFLCFVLEHLDDPHQALLELYRVLKPGGSLVVIEGDHGSCFWQPETAASLTVWNCLIESQSALGHNANIGRALYPLLHRAGFDISYLEPRWVYGDGLHPEILDGMVNQIIVPMVQTAHDHSIESGLIDEETWQQGIQDLEKTGIPPEGTFFYTWFKGVVRKSSS